MGANSPYDETYDDGDVIVNEGDETREMYIIQAGSVAVTRNINGQDVELARLHRGDFFGEMSLLESEARNATIRALGETRLLVIKPGSLLLKIRRNPTFALEMLQKLSSRVRSLNNQLKELIMDPTLSADVTARLESVRQGSIDSFQDETGP